MRELTSRKRLVDTWRSMEKEARELCDVIELALAEEDTSVETDLASELRSLWRRFENEETRLLLSG